MCLINNNGNINLWSNQETLKDGTDVFRPILILSVVNTGFYCHYMCRWQDPQRFLFMNMSVVIKLSCEIMRVHACS